MDLKELDRVDPLRHWYYQSKASVLIDQLRRHAAGPRVVLDIGAGSGFFGVALARAIPSITRVVCVDPNYPDKRLGSEGLFEFVRDVPVGALAETDVVLFVDVVEHVADDLALLRSVTDAARPGTVVVVTVPAFMSMWSSHDEFLGHHRRYRLPQLASLVDAAGLSLLDLRYLYGSIFPVAWLARRLRRGTRPATDLKPASPAVNRFLTVMLRIEHRIPWNKIAGVTALAVARVQPRGSTSHKIGP